MRLREAFDKHYDTSDLRKRTLRSYEDALTAWERLTDDPDVFQVTNETVAQFRQAAIKHGYSPVTVNRHWRHLRAVFRYLGPPADRCPWALSIIDRVPFMKPCKTRQKMPYRVPLDDISRAYVACSTAQFPANGIPAADWWRCLIVLIYFTGLRRTDLLELRFDQIDFENQSILIEAGKTWKASLFPLHPVAFSHVKRVWKPGVDRVLHGVHPEVGGRFYRRWGEILKRGKVSRHFTLHDLRRTAGSEIERTRYGMAHVLLQHSPRNVTDASYLNALEELRDCLPKMRVPVGFKAGPKMRERAERKAREERVRIRADEFFLPAANPDDWSFGPASFTFQGKTYFMSGNRLRLLERLATSPEPVPIEPLAKIVLGDDVDTTRHSVVKRVHIEIAKLRTKLRAAFGLEADWNPVCCLERGQGGLYVLHIPTNGRAGK